MRGMLAAAVCLSVLLAAGCASSGATRGSDDDAESPAAVNTELGFAYMRRGDHEVALQKLNRALELDPEYADAHTGLAVLYEQIGKPEQALEHYRKAVEFAPESGNAHNNLGQFLCKRGEYEASERHFRQAMNDPFYKTPEVAYTNAGICVQRIPAMDRAEEYFRAALEARPKYPNALYRLSRLKFERGEYMSARAFLERYSDVAPMTPEVLYLGVRIERNLGDEGAARGYASALNSQFPDSPEARRLADSSDK